MPLGYDAVDRSLQVNEAEARTVRTIFARYVELGSVRELRADLDRRGIVTKRREGASGNLRGGKRFSRGALYALLQNPIYVGRIAQGDKEYEGQHERIVPQALWQAVQQKLRANRHERAMRVNANEPSPLAGRIVDAGGEAMVATHATKGTRSRNGSKSTKRYRYYVSRSLMGDGAVGRRVAAACTGATATTAAAAPTAMRVPAGEIEGLVADRLLALMADPTQVADALVPLGLDARQLDHVLSASKRIAEDSWDAVGVDRYAALRGTVQRVIVATDRIVLDIDRSGLASLLTGGAVPTTEEERPIGEVDDACDERSTLRIEIAARLLRARASGS